ncbi:MAG: hypothetical protein IPJ36_10365 [Simplicispira sp.]|nr:hypothetical protein [Simplicispira sp.]
MGAALISERLKIYEGQDYESLAHHHAGAQSRGCGRFSNACVDIKRTHERVAVIAEFRAKETLAAEEEAKVKGASSAGKELKWLPGGNAQRSRSAGAQERAYERALALPCRRLICTKCWAESGLAAPGYRKAIELKPETLVFEEGPVSTAAPAFTWKRRQRMTDVLFLVEVGDAPARKPGLYAAGAHRAWHGHGEHFLPRH